MGSRSPALGMARFGVQQRTKAYKQDVPPKVYKFPDEPARWKRLLAPMAPPERYLQDTGERARKKNPENDINICFKNSSAVAKRNLKILSSKAAVSEAARSDGCLG